MFRSLDQFYTSLLRQQRFAALLRPFKQLFEELKDDKAELHVGDHAVMLCWPGELRLTASAFPQYLLAVKVHSPAILREYLAEQPSGYDMTEQENWYTDELGSSQHVEFALQQARALIEARRKAT